MSNRPLVCKDGEPCDYHAVTCTECEGGCKGHPKPCAAFIQGGWIAGIPTFHPADVERRMVLRKYEYEKKELTDLENRAKVKP